MERDGEEPQAVVVVATPIEEDQERPKSSRRSGSARARTRRRRSRPASAAAGERGSSTERERERGRRRPASAATFGSPERLQSHDADGDAAAADGQLRGYSAWGALDNTLQSVDEAPDDSRARTPVDDTGTDEERSDRRRRSKRRSRGRSARSERSERRVRDSDVGGERERRPRGSRRGRSARRRRGEDNLDDEDELLEDTRWVSEGRGPAGRPATAGTMRVPHVPSDIARPSSGSVASFRSVSARPTARPSEMVGLPPNMDGRNWVQPNRPAEEEQLKSQQRQRSARRVRSARSTHSFEQRDGIETVRAAEVVKPEPWLTGDGEADEQKSKWWSRSKAVQIAAAVTHSADGKVKVKQKLNFDGSVPTTQETRRAQKKDAVEVFVHEHQRELVEYFQSGYLQLQLPRVANLIRKSLGMRSGVRRLLSLLCCAMLALGVYVVYLLVQIDFVREELYGLQNAGVSGRSHDAQADSAAQRFSTTVALQQGVIPHDQFVRVCRCSHRAARTTATHVVAFEAVVNHVYGDHTAASHGRTQLVSGISLYDVSVPWSPTSSESAGSSSGYCGAGGDRSENHECADQLGEEFGPAAKLLWQWSPDRRGEGIPANDATFFRFPAVHLLSTPHWLGTGAQRTLALFPSPLHLKRHCADSLTLAFVWPALFEQEAGLRLDAGRPYSFLVQVDYDMGYFFGRVGGGDATGQGRQPINSVGAGRLEWCVLLCYRSTSLRHFCLSVSLWCNGHREQWQPWDQSGVVLHETTGLRRHDAAVLSLVQMDFALGSAIRLPGRTDRGLTVQLPPLVKTEAMWSVDKDAILVPDASATILAFGGKTRSLGKLHISVNPWPVSA